METIKVTKEQLTAIQTAAARLSDVRFTCGFMRKTYEEGDEPDSIERALIFATSKAIDGLYDQFEVTNDNQ